MTAGLTVFVPSDQVTDAHDAIAIPIRRTVPDLVTRRAISRNN